MIKVFYHNDADGRCSAAITYKYFHKNCELYEMDYVKDFDFSLVTKEDIVYMIDYCVPPFDLMLKLNESCKRLIWIDHHISSVQDYDKRAILIDGIRDISHSACMLTWMYFYPDTPAGWAVKYIEDLDIWKWEFGDNTKNFFHGLELWDYHPESVVWEYLFDKDPSEFIEKLMPDGEIVSTFKASFWKEIVDSFGFPVTFEGYTNCYACNQGKSGSTLFSSLAQQFDIVIPFVYDGKSKQWRVSLYSKTVDVAEIAKKFGGGGHTRAAGFETKTFPF
jgi:uncharacterized protein